MLSIAAAVATIAASSLFMPLSAAAAIPSAPCQPDGVSRQDDSVADQVRPAMTGRRLGRAVNGYHVSCARAIVANVQARGLNQRAAAIAVTAAITESTLHNYTVAVDHDSLGLFQQRPSKGWGQPAQLVDPRYATHAFLNAMIRKHPGGAWLTGDIGQICQRVQGSAFPLAYAPEAFDAQLLVARLWSRTAAPAARAVKEAQPAKPRGPFQRTLLAAATGRGATDARHDLSLADWNGDRRPDLVVVQRSGTPTGRTEVYILDGTTGPFSLQRLLLHTGTVLGPTDERHAFSTADWNGDGRLDLVVVQRSGTVSGRIEIRVIDGASNFQRYLLEAVTAMNPADGQRTFSVADWNGDARPDLVAVQTSGTASGRTEVRVLDGASTFQRPLLEAVTALGASDGRFAFSVADFNGDGSEDLLAVQRSGAASHRTEVRVLNGATGLRRDLLKAATAVGPTDERHAFAVADWDGDGRLDLVVLQKSGTATGRTEARVLAG